MVKSVEYLVASKSEDLDAISQLCEKYFKSEITRSNLESSFDNSDSIIRVMRMSKSSMNSYIRSGGCNNGNSSFITSSNQNNRDNNLNDKSKVVGFISSKRVLDEAEIHFICVDSKYQRMGIGSSFLEEYLKELSYLGVTKFFIEVRVSNDTAINLYKKFGFVEYARRKEYYSDREDCICMMLERE